MSVHDDLAAAGHALDALQAAATALGGHYHESLDLRRLREDVARVAVDLDLLRAALAEEPAAPASAPAAGNDYDPAFWADGDSDDMGNYSAPSR
jgi:hypothetical protein